jgi:FKBP-type peptidyl-prolyl cis-trans isomerase
MLPKRLIPRRRSSQYNGRMRILLSVALLALAAIAPSAQTPATQVPAPSDVAAPPADASKTSSGLETKVMTSGTGKNHPGKDEIVTISYTGWTTEGKMFDTSRGRPATIPVNRMIPGLGEGVQLMVVGESRRLWIPESLTYKGQQGKPKGTLVFDVTLVDLPLRAPADLKTPPADAQHTPSGLVYQVLRPGNGARHPGKADQVTVNYTGWSSDGKMFDSSLPRGQPTTLPLDHVIPGWTEGMQLMVEGEKTRFWIPQKLAYQGNQAPFGTLVFDIELVKIQ